MEKGLHVSRIHHRNPLLNGTCLTSSDYRGLKKRITAIKEQIIAQRQATKEANKNSSSYEGTPAPFSPSSIVRRRTIQGSQYENGVKSQNSPVLVRGNSYSGTPRTTQPEGANSAPPGRYGSFGLTPPLADGSVYGRGEAPNSPPEMTLPPPIKSISDLHINTLPVEGGSGKKNVGTSDPNPVRVYLSRWLFLTFRQALSESPLSPRNPRSSIRVDNSPVTPKRPRMLTSFSAARRRGNSVATSCVWMLSHYRIMLMIVYSSRSYDALRSSGYNDTTSSPVFRSAG